MIEWMTDECIRGEIANPFRCNCLKVLSESYGTGYSTRYVNTVQWYAELSYATCSSVQRLLSALSCFVRLTQGFIKCRVGRHDAGGLWKCVLVCVCSRFASPCACVFICVLVCVWDVSVTPVRMPVFAYDYMCSLVPRRACTRVFWSVFPIQGLCPLKGVPASQLRERKTRSEAGRGVKTGTKTIGKSRGERQRMTDGGDCRKAAPECGACCFEPCSRCLCIANSANITTQAQAGLG